MAIMKSMFLGASALIAVVQAAPVVLTITDVVTQTHWETIDCTTTIWRPINESPAPTTRFSNSTVNTVSTVAPTSVVVSSSTTTSVYVAPVLTTSSSTITTTTAAVTTTLVTTPALLAAAVVITTSSSSSIAAVAASTPVARAGNFVAASPSANCEGQGNACVGDITHWDGGLGACGWNVDTANDLSIALPYGFMGTQSNGNPYCGRAVTVYDPTTGITIQAKVGDKCMGCVDRAIDCTDKLFNAVTAGKGDGRVSGIQWWFTE